MDTRNLIVNKKSSILQALKVIEKGNVRTAFVCDSKKLIGVVSDGDIRRAILSGSSLSKKVHYIMNKTPIFDQDGKERNLYLDVLISNDINALPIVNKKMELLRIETIQSLNAFDQLDNYVFIMAGGFGTRLKPLTDKMPKVMLDVGEKPMLENIIDRFKLLGFRNFLISTHFFPEKIKEYFKDGKAKGINIEYTHEEQPLGTAGALSLIKNKTKKPIIMINGDILTDIDFRSLLAFHEKSVADFTICTKEREYSVPYGVVLENNNEYETIIEKPVFTHNISTGIYVIGHKCLKHVKGKMDMPDFIKKIYGKKLKVSVNKTYNYWLDIGKIEDYLRAQKDIKNLNL